MPTQAPQLGQRSEFAELSRQVRQAGLLDRRRGYYLARIAFNLLAFAATGVLFVLIGDSWWQLATAAVFAVLCTQLSFIGHDAGHRQIFHGKRANDLVGYVHSGLVGVSYGWWVGEHNQHHANPNHEGRDPDVDIPLLAFSERQSRVKRGFQRWFVKNQAFLFFPLLLLEGLNLHRNSVDAVRRGDIPRRPLEAALLVAHAVGYLAAVFTVLSPGIAVAFIAVHQGLWGLYMGCSFAPNHKGMPMLTSSHSLDFLRRQVLTARNVRGGRWVDVLLGGLNYQIEHHLFPTMPRPNLRKAQAVVHRFCVEHDISYSECGILQSYAAVLRHLHALGAPLRRSPAGVGA